MGVRGLTSFIARNAERYLHPHELHDCDLVIDGDNLACNLFKDVSGSNPAFGGDYDSFYRTVIHFFQLLEECRIRPFVLMDGGYEHKKLKTLEQRLRSKIGMVKHLNPMQSKPLFPLMMREVFVEAARDCGVSVMRCIFEADDELAVLARKLNCPVLSYDSDFYIHNVKYIPLVTVTLKVQTKSTMDQQNDRKLRHCEAKNIAKRTQIQTESEDSKPAKKAKHRTIKYLDCCMYTIKNLAGQYLKTEMLTIFAALMGNDYVERRAFRKFYSQLGLRGLNNTASKQQKRIKAILKWLRHETKESAVEKILAKVPKEQRGRLQALLEGATSGYSCEVSESFEYFGLNEEDIEIDEEETESDEELNYIESSDDENENVASDAEEDDQCEENVVKDEDEIGEVNTDDENIETGSDEDVDDNEIINEMTNQKNSELIPVWLKKRIVSAELPRYFSDLINLRMYINNPLVENFLFEDCNEIALKILQYIFTIVNQPNTPELRYLTRVVRLTNVHYKAVQPLELDFTYDPDVIDMDHFKAIFFDLPDHEKIFENIEKIPNHLQLYFLAISFWARKTKRSSHIHLHSLIICLIALSIIDGKIEPIRNAKSFNKKFGKIAAKARKAKPIFGSEDTKKDNVEKLEESEDGKKSVPILHRIRYIPKADCVLVMENLLKYFHINECFQRRHNDFSSTVLHGFSEFQSIFYHLSALNALFNYPFEAVRISQCFNGLFVYNMYTNLKNRPDIEYYVLHFLFHESTIMLEYYSYLMEWCSDLVPMMEKNDTNKPAVNRKLAKAKKKAATRNNVANQDGARVEAAGNSDGSDFDDVNNKFCMLLKVQ